jgi:hypothetical protein
VIDFNSIYVRNIDLLAEYLIEFKIKIPLEELIRDYTSIFAYSDNTEAVKRFRLIGTKKPVTTYPNQVDQGHVIQSVIPSSEKTKRVQLYVLNRKAIDSMDDTELVEMFTKFMKFTAAFRQVKLFGELQKEETDYDNAQIDGEYIVKILTIETM